MVTYNKMPLYYWVKDKKPGDATGQDVGKVWYVIDPSGKMIDAKLADMKSPAVKVLNQEIRNGSLTVTEVVSPGAGWIVIHSQADGKPGSVIGYAPVKDGVNSDVSIKIDAPKATATLYAMLHFDVGKVGTFEFPGADLPVILNNQMVSPDFMLANFFDEPTVKVMKDANLGDILVDGKGMTLYLFTKDQPGKSTCDGGCLQNWPPLLTNGKPKAGDGIDAAKLGSAKLADGRMIVTYKQIPLYYFIKDTKSGDTTGNGIGGVWAVVNP
jgi:predicted lipoprotein with Yx(FWY)xxD motif